MHQQITKLYGSAYDLVRTSLVQRMDMRTLLSWRATNRRNYVDTCHELRTSLEYLLADFVPSPAALLTLLSRTRGVLAGELAIRYILRDPSVLPQSLDIYLGSIWFDTFIETFGDSHELYGFRTDWSLTTYIGDFIETRHVTDTVSIALSNGNSINIHAAASPSACHALACSPSTIGTTFVMEFTFATAYPRLTLSRRAIICWDLLATAADSELDMYDRLADSGLTFEEDPAVWFQPCGCPASDVLPSPSTSPSVCLRSLYLCPQQGRYFGDGGSMVCFMDSLSMDTALLKDRCIPPYGVMAVWRLPLDRPCDAGCREYDDILAPGVIVTSLMLESESVMTGRYSCTSTVYGHDAAGSTGLRGRGRSVSF